MENIRELQMTLTLFLGAGSAEAKMLPTRLAKPVNVLRAPSAVLPPPALDKSMAGSAAS